MMFCRLHQGMVKESRRIVVLRVIGKGMQQTIYRHHKKRQAEIEKQTLHSSAGNTFVGTKEKRNRHPNNFPPYLFPGFIKVTGVKQSHCFCKKQGNTSNKIGVSKSCFKESFSVGVNKCKSNKNKN